MGTNKENPDGCLYLLIFGAIYLYVLVKMILEAIYCNG